MNRSIGLWSLLALACCACSAFSDDNSVGQEDSALGGGWFKHKKGGSGGTGSSTSSSSTGGALPSTGGALPSTGGALPSTGGVLPSTGGVLPSTGGVLPSTGGTATTDPIQPPGTTASPVIRLPDANASFDYQIGAAYTPPAGVKVVSRDRNSPPAPGLYNICYVNGFQTQPDEESFWTGSHPDLLLKNASGQTVKDENWGELLLDTRTAAKRAALAGIIGQWIAKCATDGFQAIEVDNLDSYSRSSNLMTQAQNIQMMRLLSDIAHAKGLAVAQKNSTELLGNVADMGTDFAVAEECNRWGECEDYRSAYGDRVFIIEYRSQDFTAGCKAFPGLSIVLRDLNVTGPTSSSYVYKGC